MRDEDLAMHVHGDTDSIFGAERELDIAGSGIVELVPGAAGPQEVRNPLHHEGVAIENLGFVQRRRSGGGDGGGRDVGGGPVVDIGLAGHHLEERGAGSGLGGRGGHWVQKARGEGGVKLGEAGREVVGLRLGGVVAVGGGGGVGEVHYRGEAPRREADPVGGGRFGQCRWFGFGFGL